MGGGEEWAPNYPVLQIWTEFRVLRMLQMTSSQVRFGNFTSMAKARHTSCFSRHFEVYYCIQSSRWGLVGEVASSLLGPRATWTQNLPEDRGRQRILMSRYVAWGSSCWTTLLAQVLVWICEVGLHRSKYAPGKSSESWSWKRSELVGKVKSLQHLRSLFLESPGRDSWVIWHMF